MRLRDHGPARGARAAVRRPRRRPAPGLPRHRAQRQRRSPPGRREPAQRQEQATMKNEDTRNLFLAIALSVLVMAAWQYFYAGPLYQKQHQAQLQAQSSGAKPGLGAVPAGRRPGGERIAERLAARRRASPGAAATDVGAGALSRRPRASPSTRRASRARSTSRAASSTTSCSRTTARRSTRIAR